MRAKTSRGSFGQSLDDIIGSIWTSDYHTIVSELTRLEEHQSKGRRRLQVDHKRAIGDVRLLAAHKKQIPIAECETLFSERMRLGFRTIADEAIAVAGHARYCRQRGELDLAARYAKKILTKIKNTRETARPPVPSELEAALVGVADKR